MRCFVRQKKKNRCKYVRVKNAVFSGKGGGNLFWTDVFLAGSMEHSVDEIATTRYFVSETLDPINSPPFPMHVHMVYTRWYVLYLELSSLVIRCYKFTCIFYVFFVIRHKFV